MTQFTIVNYPVFYSIIKKISDTFAEAILRIEDDLKIIFYDKAGFSYTELIYKDVIILEKGNEDYGVSLKEILKYTKYDDEVVFIIKDNIEIISKNKNIKFPLLDDIKPMKSKQLELKHNFIVNNKELIESIELCSSISDSFQLIANGEEIILFSEEQAKEFRYVLLKEYKTSHKSKSKFSTELISGLLIPNSIIGTINISLGDEMPLIIQYHAEKWDYLSILAPRVAND